MVEGLGSAQCTPLSVMDGGWQLHGDDKDQEHMIVVFTGGCYIMGSGGLFFIMLPHFLYYCTNVVLKTTKGEHRQGGILFYLTEAHFGLVSGFYSGIVNVGHYGIDEPRWLWLQHTKSKK